MANTQPNGKIEIGIDVVNNQEPEKCLNPNCLLQTTEREEPASIVSCSEDAETKTLNNVSNIVQAFENSSINNSAQFSGNGNSEIKSFTFQAMHTGQTWQHPLVSFEDPNRQQAYGWKPDVSTNKTGNTTTNNISEVDDSIEYESEDDQPYRFNLPSSSNGGKSYANAAKVTIHATIPISAISGASGFSGSFSSTKPTKNHQVPFESLKKLGDWKDLQKTSDEFKFLVDYAVNSCDMDALSSVRLHNAWKLPTSKSVFSKGSKGSKKQKPQDFKMLLWCKTTPETLRHLDKEDDSCMAFYDRMARALPFPASDIQGKYRQIFLLCVVTLGNSYKSPHGYQRWRHDKTPPSGYNSVKGTGKFCPNWHDNVMYKDIVVPCGNTRRNTRFPKYQIDYNEYFVFRFKQIQIKFAVDLEIIASQQHSLKQID